MVGLTRPVIPPGWFCELTSKGRSKTVVSTRKRRALTLTNEISNGGLNDRYYVEPRQPIGKCAPPCRGRSSWRRNLVAAVALDGADEMSQLSRRYHGNCRSMTAPTHVEDG